MSIEYSADKGKTWKALKASLPPQGRFTWSPAGEKGALQLRLTARDRAGNTLRLLNKYRFLLDSTPPTVRITGPALAVSEEPLPAESPISRTPAKSEAGIKSPPAEKPRIQAAKCS
ncbi:MAG: hypothetical protein N3A66_00900 [Planctomycetota bacterium]|nr:hypothetical protein [Planctomycetota bacterium]